MKRFLENIAGLFAAALIAHGATPHTGTSNRIPPEIHRDPVEAMEEAIREKQPTKARLGKIHSIWKALPEPHKDKLKNDVVCMTCIGFLLTGDAEMFDKARSAIADMKSFRDETTERCKECGGTGRVKSRCNACGGTGRCARCRGSGKISAPRLKGMGSAATMSCSSCRGSGRCVECRNGTKETRHSPCNGSGSRLSKEKCKKAFESHRSRVEGYLTNELKQREAKRLAEEQRRKEEEFEASQRAKGLVKYNGAWMTPEEKAETIRKEEEKKRFVADQKRKGLDEFNGEWLTAEELFKLGVRYHEGDGVRINRETARNLFEKASELGSLEANARLAVIFHAGDGVSKNDLLSFQYANRAGTNSPIASLVLGQLYFMGFKDANGNEVQNFRKAYSNFCVASAAPLCSFMKGLMEYHGVGTTRDEVAASSSFQNALRAGDLHGDDNFCGFSAMCLGDMYLFGNGVERDEQYAWKLFCRGARVAFPKLVAEAKQELTASDIIRFKQTFGDGLTTFTPYSYKMWLLYKGEGDFSHHGAKLDLLEDALHHFFSPDFWRDYKIDEM